MNRQVVHKTLSYEIHTIKIKYTEDITHCLLINVYFGVLNHLCLDDYLFPRIWSRQEDLFWFSKKLLSLCKGYYAFHFDDFVFLQHRIFHSAKLNAKWKVRKTDWMELTFIYHSVRFLLTEWQSLILCSYNFAYSYNLKKNFSPNIFSNVLKLIS